MKRDRGMASKLLLSLRYPSSASLASLGASFVCFSVSAVLLVNCWWYLTFRPWPVPLLGPMEAWKHGGAQVNDTQDCQEPVLSGQCDVSIGEWRPDMHPPLYTNVTCPYIQPSQNCLMNGRPDRGYLHWKWKPFDCELPLFNATRFLELMQSKKMAFIGDSLARNHMQALQCTLTQVEDPLNLYSDSKDKEYKWLFPSYNFTLTNLWSPFLVNFTVEQNIYMIYLDIPDEVWSKQLPEYDIAVVSTGYWYFRKSVYHVNDTVLGASPGSGLNVTEVEMLMALRQVMANVLKHMTTEYNGTTVLRTVTVDHFEHGSWSHGGVCNRTRPFSHQDHEIPPLPWMNNEMNKVETEEFEKAMAYVDEKAKLRLLNVTYSAYLRPDGHPGPYRIRQPNEPPNDCLHWCLPGPIDMWNQLLLYTLQQRTVKRGVKGPSKNKRSIGASVKTEIGGVVRRLLRSWVLVKPFYEHIMVVINGKVGICLKMICQDFHNLIWKFNEVSEPVTLKQELPLPSCHQIHAK